nr:glycosyltransferase family 1 protein [Frondihabitans australicus]
MGAGAADRPLDILLDCRYVRTGQHDGISRFTAGLVTALAPLAAARGHRLRLLVSDRRQLSKLPRLPFVVGTDPTSPFEPLVATRINRLAPDIVWSPMQTMGTFGRGYRLVLTLHDLIYYTNRTPPPEFNPVIRMLWRAYHLAWWPQRLLLNRADAVVTVSSTTAAAIAEHRLTARPVSVVANAADPAPSGLVARTAPATRDLVYMGSFMPYKNVATLASAMQSLAADGYRLHLMSRVSPAQRASLSALAPAGSLVFHDGASDDEYQAVLLGATAVVSASLNEGFGIPLVEGMVLGTPAVVSDIPIFREIGGEAAMYFEPSSPASVAAAVRRVSAPDEWAARSAASLAQAARFSWDASAGVLLDLLERTARG